MQLKTLGESTTALSKLKEALQQIDTNGTVGMPRMAEENRLLAEAFSGCSMEATKMAITQSSLNQTQIEAILKQKGLKGEILETTTADLANAASVNAVAAAEKKATASTIGFGNAVNGLGVVKQCVYNNIPIFNTAINEQKWNNCMKINHILECLEQIKTDYVLILDERDTLIVNDLNATFIEKYLSYKIPVVYNATPVPYPNAVVEPLQELLKISGTHKFLNAGICVGIKEALVEFYKHAKIINDKIYNNSSEQYIIRLAKEKNPSLTGIDNELKLFRIVHQYDTIIKENNNIVQLI